MLTEAQILALSRSAYNYQKNLGLPVSGYLFTDYTITIILVCNSIILCYNLKT